MMNRILKKFVFFSLFVCLIDRVPIAAGQSCSLVGQISNLAGALACYNTAGCAVCAGKYAKTTCVVNKIYGTTCIDNTDAAKKVCVDKGGLILQ